MKHGFTFEVEDFDNQTVDKTSTDDSMDSFFKDPNKVETPKPEAAKPEEPKAPENQDILNALEELIEPVKEPEQPVETPTSFINDATLEEWFEDGLLSTVTDKEELKNLTTVESIKELIQAEKEAAFDSNVDALLDDLGEDGVRLLKYLKHGGELPMFYDAVKNNPSNVKLTTPAEQERFLESIFKRDGMDQDEIEVALKAYKDSDKLESIAKNRQTKEIQSYTKKMNDLVEETRTKEAAAVETAKKNKTEFVETVNAIDDVFGLDIKKDKTKLINFINDIKFQRTGTGERLTEFDVKLNKALEDPSRKLFIAKLLLTDFKLDQLKSEAKTKVLSDIEKQKADVVNTTTANKNSKVTPLLEFFNN